MCTGGKPYGKNYDGGMWKYSLQKNVSSLL